MPGLVGSRVTRQVSDSWPSTGRRTASRALPSSSKILSCRTSRGACKQKPLKLTFRIIGAYVGKNLQTALDSGFTKAPLQEKPRRKIAYPLTRISLANPVYYMWLKLGIWAAYIVLHSRELLRAGWPASHDRAGAALAVGPAARAPSEPRGTTCFPPSATCKNFSIRTLDSFNKAYGTCVHSCQEQMPAERLEPCLEPAEDLPPRCAGLIEGIEDQQKLAVSWTWPPRGSQLIALNS